MAVDRLRQMDLFGDGLVAVPQAIPIAPGRFALAEKVAVVMARAVKACGVPRKELAGRVTALTGKQLTLSVLDAMASQSKSGHVPNLLQAMAIDAITGTWALLQFYAEAAGGLVIFGDDIVALEMGRLALAQEHLRKEVKKRSDGLKRIAGRV